MIPSIHTVGNLFFAATHLRLNLRIVHDNSWNYAVDTHTARFVEFDRARQRFRNFSNNDRRYLDYYETLKYRSDVKRVLFLDGTDVLLRKDPFKYMMKYGDDQLFLSSDVGTILSNDWMK